MKKCASCWFFLHRLSNVGTHLCVFVYLNRIFSLDHRGTPESTVITTCIPAMCSFSRQDLQLTHVDTDHVQKTGRCVLARTNNNKLNILEFLGG